MPCGSTSPGSTSLFTHDIRVVGVTNAEVHLTAQPFGISHRHESGALADVPFDLALGPGGYALSSTRHAYLEDVVSFAVDEIPAGQYAAMLVVLCRAGQGEPVEYSPLRSTSYSGSYLLTSTAADWTRTRWGRYAGRVELRRQGSAY